MVNYKNEIVQDDLERIFNTNINWKELDNKTILVTGATGMIASYFAFMILFLNEKKGFNIKIVLLARSEIKLLEIFGPSFRGDRFFEIIQDINEEIEFESNVDYIFHAAGSADPFNIINNPVGIISANVIGTFNVLKLARQNKTQKVVFTSTREIYGEVSDNIAFISENDNGILNPLEGRSCYPESKRLAETLLESYFLQFGIKYNTLRIAHTYGPGIPLANDGRVMSDLLNFGKKNIDILLNSTGSAERAFCYISDTIEGIFWVLTNGKDCEAYNIANETEPISIYNLGKSIQEIFGNGKTVIKGEDSVKAGYCAYKRVGLDTSKLKLLGWSPKTSIYDGLRRTIKSFQN